MLAIKHKREDCIGCAFCAEVAPNYWKMDEEGLAQLHQILDTAGSFEIGQGFEEDREALKEAEFHCPVSIIKIEG
ncbi:ferredoxin [Pelagicoccus sp. SDUM812002]|uniref:ferredoxin n=1 Tax=Pelagicoccus sp. SDUM812002 TaxID=3041266 RepID=UPI00280FC7A6|nr:ferredoxin [Pelagicoccus sp. SDUM812002]MDQ8185903.1 ferredoxin [Pelagicoccus sp. SDUM812002]